MSAGHASENVQPGDRVWWVTSFEPDADADSGAVESVGDEYCIIADRDLAVPLDNLVQSPIVCHPFCTSSDGHPREKYREEQQCWGSIEAVALMVEYRKHRDDLDFVPTVKVMANAEPGHDAVVHALIALGPGDAWLSFDATPIEAVQIAHALLTVAAQAGGRES